MEKRSYHCDQCDNEIGPEHHHLQVSDHEGAVHLIDLCPSHFTIMVDLIHDNFNNIIVRLIKSEV